MALLDISDVSASEDACVAALMRADQLDAEDVFALSCRAGRNSYPWLLLLARGKIDDDTIAACVGDAWSMPDAPMSKITKADWLYLFGRAGYTVDGVRCERPSEPLKLYRGAPHKYRRRWSWTVDLEQARRFAVCHHDVDAVVWQTVAPPESLLCAVGFSDNSRQEREYIIDTRGLQITKWED